MMTVLIPGEELTPPPRKFDNINNWVIHWIIDFIEGGGGGRPQKSPEENRKCLLQLTANSNKIHQ